MSKIETLQSSQQTRRTTSPLLQSCIWMSRTSDDQELSYQACECTRADAFNELSSSRHEKSLEGHESDRQCQCYIRTRAGSSGAYSLDSSETSRPRIQQTYSILSDVQADFEDDIFAHGVPARAIARLIERISQSCKSWILHFPLHTWHFRVLRDQEMNMRCWLSGSATTTDKGIKQAKKRKEAVTNPWQERAGASCRWRLVSLRFLLGDLVMTTRQAVNIGETFLFPRVVLSGDFRVFVIC